MALSVALKSASAALLNATGTIDGRLRREGRGKTAVLMYHRVLPAGEARREKVQAGMNVEPGTLAMHLRYLMGRFDLVSLEAVLESDSMEGNSKPRCAITFDDGWRDFRLHAFPVLRDAGAPVTVFLPTDYIGSERRFWTDRLSFLVGAKKKRPGSTCRPGDDRNPLEERIGRMASEGDTGMESAIQLLKTFREEQIEGILHELASRWEVPPESLSGGSFLTWGEAREMKKSGLVTFGSHTATHRILTTMTDGEVKEELRRSLERILEEKVADPGFVPFCYPNGGFDGRIARLAREAGYHSAVTTERGWNGPGTDPFELRRVSVHQDMTSSGAMLGCRILGIY